jgi:phenylalanyl-tRNA synthetase alpha chain
MVTENVDLDFDAIAGDGERAIAGASSTEALSEVETQYLGKRSALTRAHRSLGGLDPEARKEAGRRLNEVRSRLESQ